MQIPFSLPHVFFPGSSRDEDASALRALLDCLIRLNQAYLRNHPTRALYSSGVVYGRTEVWDTIPALYKRKYGDCKSLTAALIAEYRVVRKIEAEPVFRWVMRADGTGSDYHILVQREVCKECPSGFEDPSKVLGMGRDENKHFRKVSR